MEIVIALYMLVVLWLSLYGFNAIWLTILYLRHRHDQVPLGTFDEWPVVTVQVPVYNERYVVERVIDAVAALDYPRDRLQIQILDDSTDDTTALAHRRVEAYRAQGIDITLIHREHRQGYKAGALRHALAQARGEFIAIFDADFIPAPDFLQRMLPAFAGQPRVGFVQARWTHLNAEASPLTHALALAGDAHFIVEQVGRNRGGLLVNFNGSAGLWRRAALESAGGWQEDTLTEDLDLCYRAQIAGWKAVVLPEVTVPAELPTQVGMCKQQQFRWAKGGAQTLRKLFGPLMRSRLSWRQKIAALLHLTMYMTHLLMLLLLATWLPVMSYSNTLHRLPLAFFSVSALGLPLVCIISQIELYRDWPRRIVYLPFVLSLGCGLTVNNAWAFLQGLFGARGEFVRTPKGKPAGHAPRLEPVTYRPSMDATILGEMGLAAFTAFLVAKAQIQLGYSALPYLLLYMVGFTYVAFGSLWTLSRQAWAMWRALVVERLASRDHENSG